jgi:hypothetical protein
VQQADAAGQKPKKTLTQATRPWGRLLVGTFMGYIAAVSTTSAFTALLPIHRSEAVFLGLIFVSLVWVSLLVYVFAIPSWLRGFRDLTLLTILGGLILAIDKLVLAV